MVNFLQKRNFLKNLEKAYTEGIYADTPANRKLGRVGMSYIEYANKIKMEKKIKESESYLKEAKSIANLIVNEKKFINLWGKEFSRLISSLNKENDNLKSLLVSVKNEDQYNLFSQKQEKVSSKLRFYKDLKKIANNHLNDKKNISIQDWLKQFLK